MIRNWLRNFMLGRYGPDHLGTAMAVLALVLGFIGGIIGFYPLNLLSYVVLVMVIYRMLSRNIERRRAENDRFISLAWPLKKKVRIWVERLRSRKQYRFFKCPACGNILRVPRHKGRVKITCPKCGERFERKT